MTWTDRAVNKTTYMPIIIDNSFKLLGPFLLILEVVEKLEIFRVSNNALLRLPPLLPLAENFLVKEKV